MCSNRKRCPQFDCIYFLQAIWGQQRKSGHLFQLVNISKPFFWTPLIRIISNLKPFNNLNFQVWRCAPIAKGVGFGMVVLSLIVSIYYNVIMAYSIFYVGASFYGVTGDLPWTYCGKFYFETMGFSINSVKTYKGACWRGQKLRQNEWLKVS